MATDFKPCSVPGCNRNASPSARGSRGFCSPHYQRMLRHGSPDGGRAMQLAHGPTCALPGCKEAHHSGGFCQRHYKRNARHGTATGGGTDRGATHRWIAEHAAYPGDECLIWPFARSDYGYGLTTKDGKTASAHRVICETANGPPPQGKHYAAHSCGKGHEGCVNPRHLYWATASQNAFDTIDHGRFKPMQGQLHGMAKLTDVQVVQMRKMKRGGVPNPSLAAQYKVSIGTVRSIVEGRRWKHLL